MTLPNIRKIFDLSSAKPHYHNLSDKIPFAGNIGRHKARTSYQYDMHYGLEFGIVLNGKKNIIFPDFKLNLSAGNVWFCGMWEPHGWSAGRAPSEDVNLVIWPPALAGLRFDETAPFNWLAPFTVPPPQRPQTCKATMRLMLDLGGKIKNCLQERENRTWLWLRLFVMEAILLATDQWSEKQLQFSIPAPGGSLALSPWPSLGRRLPGRRSGLGGQAGIGGQAVARLNQVLRRFFDNHGMMTTGEAAEICGLNRNAFSKMFHGLMGLSFADFVLRYRLDAAASSLHQTDESVKSIALLWGFADTSHFDRMFVKYYGCTPHEYRQKNASAPSL